jgi:hypothetical protein
MVEWKQSLFRAFREGRTLLLGIIIALIPIVNFAVYGFGLQCARKPYDKKLPGWSGFGALWVQGLQAIVIMLVYALPALILFGIALVTAFAPAASVATAVVGLLASYVLPIAWIAFATGGFRDAFGLGAIIKKSFTWKYLRAWLGVLAIAFVIGLVSGLVGLLLSVTIVGPILINVVSAVWLMVFSFTVYGQVYEELT